MNQQFILNDLDSALRVAKEGDKIFLEEGTYTPPTSGPESEKKSRFEFRKGVNVCGEMNEREMSLFNVINPLS